MRVEDKQIRPDSNRKSQKESRSRKISQISINLTRVILAPSWRPGRVAEGTGLVGSLDLIVLVEPLPGLFGDFFCCRQEHVEMLFDLQIVQLIDLTKHIRQNQQCACLISDKSIVL